MTIGRVIVSLERWRLDGPLNQKELNRVRVRLKIPDRVDLINEDDPPLALNLRSRSCREMLQTACAKSGSVILQERWPGEDRWAVKGASGHYAHELILPLQTGQPDEQERDRHYKTNDQEIVNRCETSSQWHSVHLECALSGDANSPRAPRPSPRSIAEELTDRAMAFYGQPHPTFTFAFASKPLVT